MLWLYLHFPRLQLDTLFSKSNASPICILHKNRIVQLNDAAKEVGLKVDMGLGYAATLSNDLQVYPYNINTEQKRLAEIAQHLYTYTADISLSPPKGLLLKVTDMLALYEGLNRYWQAIKTPLDELELSYHFATGYSPYCARLLAQEEIDIITNDNDMIEDYIHNSLLSATELTTKSVEKLARVGIHRLKELLHIDMPEVARRFDIELVNYVGKLTGKFKHPVEYYSPPEHFHRELELLFELDKVQWLEKPLHKLFVQLETFLKHRDQVAYELTLTLLQRDEQEKPKEIPLTSAQGEYRADKWQTLSQLTLESVQLSSPVVGICLSAVRIGYRPAEKNDLFDGKKGEFTSQELISLLQAKLGKSAVKGISLTSDPRPEYATQLCTPLSRDSVKNKPKQIRPSVLFPTPVLLQEKISLIQGPERIVTGWWDAQTVTRDYFIARGVKGQWLWVFKTPQREWFIHGVFC